MSTLIIVAGLPGAGKTTLCKLIEKKLNCKFLDDDEYAKSSPYFKPVDITKITSSQFIKIREKFWNYKLNDLKALLLKNDLVVTDIVFDLISVRRMIYNMLKSIHSDHIIVEVICSDTIIRKRIREDLSKTRPGASPETRLYAYERMKANWKPIYEDHITVDSNDPQEVKTLLRTLKNKTKNIISV